MGVAYYANHLVWFEVARTDFLKSLGISYRNLEERDNLRLMVVESYCKYKNPVTYDDEIVVETFISQIKNSSLSFEYKIKLDEKIVAEGKTTHVFTDTEGKAVRIPQDIRSKIGGVIDSML